MDPITILAACTAVWNGIKKTSEFAQEAEGVWSRHLIKEQERK